MNSRIVAAMAILLALMGCEGGPKAYYADGSIVDATVWQDRYLIINYWAKWCGPCRAEIPELNELHHARDTHDLVIVGVNYDLLTGTKLNEDVDALGIEFPVLTQDPQLQYGFDRATILPMTVVINPQGEVHDVLVGPQTQDSLLATVAAGP